MAESNQGKGAREEAETIEDLKSMPSPRLLRLGNIRDLVAGTGNELPDGSAAPGDTQDV